MKRTAMLATLVAGLLTSIPAWAKDMSYNYVGVAYGSYSFSGLGSFSGTGFSFDGSYDVAPNINLIGSYDSSSYSGGGTINELTAGIGYHMPMGGWDLLGDVRYRSTDVSGFPTFTGYVANVGGRFAVSDQLELKATVGYTSQDNGAGSGTGSTYAIGGVYQASDNLGVTLGYTNDPDVISLSAVRLGVRYMF
jgi:hypothetical protein